MQCDKVADWCSQCSNARTCTACWVGYTLESGYCIECQYGCANCDGGRNLCRECKPFHAYDPHTQRCVPF